MKTLKLSRPIADGRRVRSESTQALITTHLHNQSRDQRSRKLNDLKYPLTPEQVRKHDETWAQSRFMSGAMVVVKRSDKGSNISLWRK